jgi:hypothetical protein
MKKFLTVLLLLAVVIAGLWLSFFKNKKDPDPGPKQQPLAVSKHSDIFNISAQKMIGSYYSLTEGFVLWDTVSVNKYAQELKVNLDSLRLDQLQKDTVIYQTASSVWANAKAEIDGLLKDGSLEEKRLALNSLTQYIYDLLRTIRYDQSKIYFQECPMAFGEEQPGNWLSKTPAVRNPYLGTQHPKYKDGMVGCGGPKDTLNFLVTESTK